MTQIADTAPGPYYISVIRESGFKDARLLSGPYPTHQEALDLVDKARSISERHDPRAVWYAFGTLRMKDAFTEPGILQKWGYDLNLEREPEQQLASWEVQARNRKGRVFKSWHSTKEAA